MEAEIPLTKKGKPDLRNPLAKKKRREEIEKGAEKMAAFLKPRSVSPPPELPKSPVKKRRRAKGKGKGKKKFKRQEAGLVFEEPGSYWQKPTGRRRKKREPTPRKEKYDSDSDTDIELELLPKRKAPIASLPGVQQKKKRKDKKQADRRAKVVEAPEQIADDIANLLAATDAMAEHQDEEEAVLQVHRRDIDRLEERREEGDTDLEMEIVLDSALQQAAQKLQADNNYRLVQERELEEYINEATDQILQARANLKQHGSAPQNIQSQGWAEEERAFLEEREKLQKELEVLQGTIERVPRLIVTDRNASEEVFNELLHGEALEDLPEVPSIPESQPSSVRNDLTVQLRSGCPRGKSRKFTLELQNARHRLLVGKLFLSLKQGDELEEPKLSQYMGTEEWILRNTRGKQGP